MASSARQIPGSSVEEARGKQAGQPSARRRPRDRVRDRDCRQTAQRLRRQTPDQGNVQSRYVARPRRNTSQPPTKERMARITSGSSMTQGDSCGTPPEAVARSSLGVGPQSVVVTRAAHGRRRDARVCRLEVRLAEERHEPQPEHVERGHARGNEADEPEELAPGSGETNV